MVGEFGLEVLAAVNPDERASPERVVTLAIRYYLADRDAGQAGWAYPDLRRGEELGATTTVSIAVDDATWRCFEREAERQRVSSDELAQHAVLYFAAARSEGRLADDVAEGLGDVNP
jgi:hypothetical protein